MNRGLPVADVDEEAFSLHHDFHPESAMTIQRLIFPALMIGLLGVLFGCTPTTQPATADKANEAKIAKLEKELKATQDDAMAKAAQLRLEQAKLVKVEAERKELQTSLRLRTGERDTIAVQYDTFRKTIKDVLGQADAAANSKPGDTSVSVLPNPKPVR